MSYAFAPYEAPADWAEHDWDEFDWWPADWTRGGSVSPLPVVVKLKPYIKPRLSIQKSVSIAAPRVDLSLVTRQYRQLKVLPEFPASVPYYISYMGTMNVLEGLEPPGEVIQPIPDPPPAEVEPPEFPESVDYYVSYLGTMNAIELMFPPERFPRIFASLQLSYGPGEVTDIFTGEPTGDDQYTAALNVYNNAAPNGFPFTYLSATSLYDMSKLTDKNLFPQVGVFYDPVKYSASMLSPGIPDATYSINLNNAAAILQFSQDLIDLAKARKQIWPSLKGVFFDNTASQILSPTTPWASQMEILRRVRDGIASVDMVTIANCSIHHRFETQAMYDLALDSVHGFAHEGVLSKDWQGEFTSILQNLSYLHENGFALMFFPRADVGYGAPGTHGFERVLRPVSIANQGSGIRVTFDRAHYGEDGHFPLYCYFENVDAALNYLDNGNRLYLGTPVSGDPLSMDFPNAPQGAHPVAASSKCSFYHSDYGMLCGLGLYFNSTTAAKFRYTNHWDMAFTRPVWEAWHISKGKRTAAGTINNVNGSGIVTDYSFPLAGGETCHIDFEMRRTWFT